MILTLVPVLFLLAADQPPTTEPTPQPVVTAPVVAAPATEVKPEPKMVCKYEHVTGSRLSKQKVCRPEGETSNDQASALQREMQRNGDYREPLSSFGN